jgi:hypothetical protein
MRFKREPVEKNVRKAATEDLLDRVTVYRTGMEPEALDIIEAELRSRGVDIEQIEDYGERRRGEVLARPGGIAVRCDFCRQPAVVQEWGWHRLWGKVPLFPRLLHYCENHRPRPPAVTPADQTESRPPKTP